MDQRIFVAQLNTEHYRWRLGGKLDIAQRRLIERLLEEEEARLASLRASIAEGILSQIIDIIAQRTVDLFDAGASSDLRRRAADLVAIFDQMPCGMSLSDGLGKVILANDAMRRFVSGDIPSRDPQGLRRWRVYDSDGRVTSPVLWPGARALRGESVNPGVSAIHTSDDGQETPLRIAAVPLAGCDGSIKGVIAAAYEFVVLEREGVHQLLERVLMEEQFLSHPRGREGGAR